MKDKDIGITLQTMNLRQLFLQHNAQTSETPLCFEVSRAEGSYLYDQDGHPFIDLIGGISVCHVGHGNQKVKDAIKTQVDQYLHVMVYGEVIQSPQVLFAEALSRHLPETLDAIYFTNSGSEATEGAMKLAKRITGRQNMISFKNSYHGSTQGALSVMGSEYWQQAFRPLIPGIRQFNYGSEDAIDAINHETACIILEPVQSEAGVIFPDHKWLQAIQTRCHETGTLLILDEIQTAFGRTGSLFRFEQCGIVPDVLLLGKALGAGMPMGAFITSKDKMDQLAKDPVLGHITTFGGHPVCCAAGLAGLQYLNESRLIQDVNKKEALFHRELSATGLKLNSCGLLMALHFDDYAQNKKVIDACLNKKQFATGVFTDWFLFAANALRIAPPLSIQEEEIKEACSVIREAIRTVI